MHSDPVKVLLVDDDPAILRILSRWLEKAEYDVRASSNGRKALAAVAANCPDVVLTDWEMPGLDGLELCRRLRAMELPHYVYILFVTVKSSSEEMVTGLEAGADDFLRKPIHQGELLARMAAAQRVVLLERRLSQLASTDPLTGLLTQPAFFERLGQEWQRARRYHLPLSCMMLDIDYFKRINDTFGHPFGDSVLRAVGEVLRQSSRESDSLCRYGGEEFCAVLPETDSRAATLWAERVRRRLAEMTFPAGHHIVQITGSLGTTEIHADTQRPETLVDQADQALLCAKQSGRDRVVCYESIHSAEGLPESADGLFAGITARDVMTPLVACVRESMIVGQMVDFFLCSRISSSPVVDGEGKLVGFVSEKDLMAAMAALECWSHPVAEVMKRNVITYEEEAPIQTIYDFLCRVSIRRVVIVRRDVPTGTISRGTLLRWFRNQVIGRGLMDAAAGESCDVADSRWHGQCLVQTASTIAATASRLEDELARRPGEQMPLVVGTSTRIQELVNDLLANAREAGAGDRIRHADSLSLGSGHTD